MAELNLRGAELDAAMLETIKDALQAEIPIGDNRWVNGSLKNGDLLGGLEPWNFVTSISYMGCHPKPIDELICFKMVKTTNQ